MTFEGTIEPEEERDALLAAGSLPDLRKDARILVDRRRARMRAGPADVAPQMDLARQAFPNAGGAPMAIVVASDHDFGMARMLELRGADELPHQLGVFRDIEEACAWLGVDPSLLPEAAAEGGER